MDMAWTDGYKAAVENCAWFERTDRAIFSVRGTDALDYLNRVTTNELRDLASLHHRQTMLCTDKGRIVDLLDVFMIEAEIFVMSSLHALPQVLAHLRSYAVMDDVHFSGPLDTFSVLEISGPHTSSALRFLFGDTQELPQANNIVKLKYEGFELYALSSQALCELSFLLLVPKEDSPRRSAFLSELSLTIQQASADEYELLRLDSGHATAPSELNGDFNPLEANLLHLINFKKGCYIGQEVIARLDSYNKVQKRLVGFRANTALPLKAQIEVEEVAVGYITSVSHSPRFGHVALGYIRNEHALEDKVCVVRSVDNSVQVHLQLLPFTNVKD